MLMGGGYIGVNVNVSKSFIKKWNNNAQVASAVATGVVGFVGGKIPGPIGGIWAGIVGLFHKEIYNYVYQNLKSTGGSGSFSVGKSYFGPGNFVWNVNF